ncbi:hypothetical protein GOV11_02785 [Candidatus Woesearchaeota archaeon]|nr:hypothetical protein [Candidatus Woesearchaeota archaeon]
MDKELLCRTLVKTVNRMIRYEDKLIEEGFSFASKNSTLVHLFEVEEGILAVDSLVSLGGRENPSLYRKYRRDKELAREYLDMIRNYR